LYERVPERMIYQVAEGQSTDIAAELMQILEPERSLILWLLDLMVRFNF
jgi:hypothetical protein